MLTSVLNFRIILTAKAVIIATQFIYKTYMEFIIPFACQYY